MNIFHKSLVLVVALTLLVAATGCAGKKKKSEGGIVQVGDNPMISMGVSKAGGREVR
jgi:hypothetical protein